jgi:hypothetical protein
MAWSERDKRPQDFNLREEHKVTFTTGFSATIFNLREEFLVN